jgi:2-iminoacetate synthase ThiH
MWALPSYRRKKLENETTGFIMCFEQEKRKEYFTLCLDVRNIPDKHFSYILRLDISKFGKFTALSPADNQKKNTQWRRSITTEERLALTLRLVHISYNQLSPSSSEQLNTSQKATTFWLTNFVNVCMVAGRSRT